MEYSYPGNIRELKAIIELSAVLADNDEIKKENITFQSSDPFSEILLETKPLKEYNRLIINHFLDKYNENVLEVAEVLQIGKSTIYRMLKEDKF